ncbi:MAG: hypothetical protein CMB53_02185 [Euryarchaeota archaeon]|nr:hypothetical protein [Euryarchaeota archaeon]|tara:strand:+ start:28677 stop:29261 length:585 start_codon:yes stop_codon:yes gene_type:complete
MNMVRILSVLPGAIGSVCVLLVLGSLLGIGLEESRTDVPIVPCTDDSVGCPVGMTTDDLDVPSSFFLLDIQLNVQWDDPDRSWIGVVDAKYKDDCPPDSNGLTSCTSDDFEYEAGGPNSDGGEFEFTLKPGKYRFVTAGKDGSSLDEQIVTINTEVHLSSFVEIVLGGIGIMLLAGAGEMAFPIKSLWKKFRGA